MIVDNCVFTDFQNFALRNQFEGETTSITDCVFINGVRLRNSPWGGFPIRMDVACDNVILENNTVVNSGRLIANSGPFSNATIHEIHNTYLNQTVAGHEQRANELITANNIFYNFHFLGYKTEFHTSPNNTYDSYFTTWNFFADSKDNLENISLYLGQNLFYREQPIIDWFNTVGGDSLAPSLLWEHADVDSFIMIDDNYTIGANYSEMDPGFATHPGNTATIVDYINGSWVDPLADWSDWRITPPVSFDPTTSAPSLSWPPAFDLNYSNTFMQSAGTDGLPLGDLNWFPDDKEDYLTNRAAYIDDLRDSMVNAVVSYDPLTMDQTPLITEGTTSIFEQEVPSGFFVSGNDPNPFDQITTIKFGLHDQAEVILSVYNLLGEQVAESNEGRLSSGSNQINFDASNLNSGVYFYKLTVTDSNNKTYFLGKEMVVTK